MDETYMPFFLNYIYSACYLFFPKEKKDQKNPPKLSVTVTHVFPAY